MFDNTRPVGQTPAQIVAAVKRGGQLILAERRLAEVRDEIEQVNTRQRALLAEYHSTTNPRYGLTDEINATELELAEIGQRHREALAAVVEQQAPFLQRVDQALEPWRRDAARRCCGAMASLNAAMEELTLADRAVRRVGGEPRSYGSQGLDARSMVRNVLRSFTVGLLRHHGEAK